jgi:hypothetical protein
MTASYRRRPPARVVPRDAPLLRVVPAVDRVPVDEPAR